ncbi:hypothetical protein RN629_06960, partial [Sphingomonadaceae bacterium jetA1]
LAGTADDVTTTFEYNPASQITAKTRSNDGYAFTGYVNVNRAYHYFGRSLTAASVMRYPHCGQQAGEQLPSER